MTDEAGRHALFSARKRALVLQHQGLSQWTSVGVLRVLGPMGTMIRVIDTLRKSNIECLPSERLGLGVDMFDASDGEHPIPKSSVFENPLPNERKPIVQEAQCSHLRYFMDGSQTFHQVIDASLQGTYLPICAAQVGVAVLERQPDGTRRILRDTRLTKIKRLLLIPEGQLPKDEVRELKTAINQALPESYPFEVVEYNPTGTKGPESEQEPAYHARARVLNYMHDLELDTMQALLDARHIDRQNWLAIDGGLQFTPSPKLTGLLKDDVFARNVVALAKTPKPNLPIGGGRKAQHAGNILKDLDCGERTPAFSSSTGERLVRGFWYLRIRPRRFVYRPLQGVIKIEVFADGKEREDGLDSARVNGISSCVLHERNVTPYRADARWGTHLYPIYMAESYLKASFLSELRFKALLI